MPPRMTTRAKSTEPPGGHLPRDGRYWRMISAGEPARADRIEVVSSWGPSLARWHLDPSRRHNGSRRQRSQLQTSLRFLRVAEEHFRMVDTKQMSGYWVRKRRGPHEGLMRSLGTSVSDLRSRHEDDVIVDRAASWAPAGEI